MFDIFFSFHFICFQFCSFQHQELEMKTHGQGILSDLQIFAILAFYYCKKSLLKVSASISQDKYSLFKLSHIKNDQDIDTENDFNLTLISESFLTTLFSD